MKQSIVVFFFLAFTFSFGQSSWELESNFNSVHTGRNQSVTAGYNWGKFGIYGGLKFSFNRLDNFPVAVWYKKTAWATNFGEHLGGIAGLKYRFLDLEHLSLYGFFETQQSYTHIRHISEFIVGSAVPEPQSEWDLIYQKQEYYIGPWWFFENNIGIGINVDIWKGLYLNGKVAGGMLFFKNQDPQNQVFGASNWELSEMVSVGLGWRIKND